MCLNAILYLYSDCDLFFMGDFDLNFKKSAIIPITAEVISKRGFVVLYSTGSTLQGYLKYLYAHNAQTNDNIMQTI